MRAARLGILLDRGGDTRVLGDGMAIRATGRRPTQPPGIRLGRDVSSECIIAARPSPPGISLWWPGLCLPCPESPQGTRGYWADYYQYSTCSCSTWARS